MSASALVTKDIPTNVVTAGSPCHVLRPIDERDRESYHHNYKLENPEF